MTKSNSTAPEAATLTEQELWARFVAARIQTTYAMGPTVDSYCPADLVYDPGEYGHIGDFSAEMSDLISESDNPENELNCLIEDLTNYLEGLRTVRDAFALIKESLAIYPDENDTTATEDDIRYQVSVIEQKEAA